MSGIKRDYYLNTTKYFTLTFRSLSETFIGRSMFSSSSSYGSCYDRDAMWQEIGRTCGSALVPVQGSSSLFPNMYCIFGITGSYVNDGLMMTIFNGLYRGRR